MSYEGYEQHICNNGHLYNSPSSIMVDSEHCHICGAQSAWINMVDDTNGESVGIILDFSKFELFPAKTETCNCCGNAKVTPAIYRIPNKNEAKKLRNFWDRDINNYAPLNE